MEAAEDFLAVVKRFYPQVWDELMQCRGKATQRRLSAITKWAQSHSIDCSGVRWAAAYLTDPTASETVPSWLGKVSWQENGEHRELPSIRAWPGGETEDEFLHRAKAYYRDVCRELRRVGFRPRQQKFDLDHFEWLAMRVIEHFSIEKIAGQCHRPEQTVRKGIQNVADLIGLSLPFRPGRPRKS